MTCFKFSLRVYIKRRKNRKTAMPSRSLIPRQNPSYNTCVFNMNQSVKLDCILQASIYCNFSLNIKISNHSLDHQPDPGLSHILGSPFKSSLPNEYFEGGRKLVLQQMLPQRNIYLIRSHTKGARN